MAKWLRTVEDQEKNGSQFAINRSRQNTLTTILLDGWLELYFYIMARHCKVFSDDFLKEIFVDEESAISPCIQMFRPSQENARMTVPVILHLVKPKFAEEGFLKKPNV